MGQMLLGTEKATGGQPYQKSTSTQRIPVGVTPTLADYGLSKKESAEAQLLAEMPLSF